MNIYIVEHTQNEETTIAYAYRSLDAAMQAAKRMAEEVKHDTYDDDDDVVITVERQLVYFTIKGHASEEQWQVREIELID